MNASAKTGPREVKNRFFDDESDEEQPLMIEAPESSEDFAELDDAMKLLNDESEHSCSAVYSAYSKLLYLFVLLCCYVRA